jgi:thioesterase domain-containing protein
MTALLSPVILLPGAKGGTPAVFTAGLGDATKFKTICYPGWQRYVANDFSAELLIADLVSQIARRVPQGPIYIIGFSIGGHFGYAAALRLQAEGREIAGFCAIDTFMIASSDASVGWKSRALARGLELLRERRVDELFTFVQSLFWRALLRLGGDRLPRLLRIFAASREFPAIFPRIRIFEEELSMRLLIREVAPWIGALDVKPIALLAPAILLRTRENASDDSAWRRRCPSIEIVEIPGKHDTFFEPGNINALRESFIRATRGWNGPVADQCDNAKYHRI